MRRKDETFSSMRATTPLAAIMKSSISMVARFFLVLHDVNYLLVDHDRVHFAGFNIQRSMKVALFHQGLCDLVLEFELRLQIGRCSNLRRRRARAFQPRPHRVVHELCLVADQRPIHGTGRHDPVGAGYKLGHHAQFISVFKQGRRSGG